jgi:hypothetical protein
MALSTQSVSIPVPPFSSIDHTLHRHKRKPEAVLRWDFTNVTIPLTGADVRLTSNGFSVWSTQFSVVRQFFANDNSQSYYFRLS